MSTSLDALLLHWNRCVASTVSDGGLVRSYLHKRAEEPFRLLVERHGRMVLGVCRHRLGDPHAAEDAFQATFLLLARRAGSIYGRRVCIPIESHPTKIFDTTTGMVISTLRLKQSANWADAFLKGGDEFAYLAKDGAKHVDQSYCLHCQIYPGLRFWKKSPDVSSRSSWLCNVIAENGNLANIGSYPT